MAEPKKVFRCKVCRLGLSSRQRQENHRKVLEGKRKIHEYEYPEFNIYKLVAI
jgi:hypothetical protein